MGRGFVLIALLAGLGAAHVHAQAGDLVGVVTSGSVQEVQAAIDRGADVNAPQADTGMTPLIAASKYNQDAIPALLKAGADPGAHDTQYGATALMWAAAYAENDKVIKALLAATADPGAMDDQGHDALTWAATKNTNPEVARALLAGGANVNARDKSGGTALMAAAKADNPDVVLVLLAAGADPKAKDNLGNTALTYAQYSSLKGTTAFRKLSEASQ